MSRCFAVLAALGLLIQVACGGAKMPPPPLELLTPRALHRAVPLKDGKVLLVGGENEVGLTSGWRWLGDAELYDPATNTMLKATPMGSARCFFTATRMSDGKVLIAGGAGDGGEFSSAEVFDPETRSFVLTGEMGLRRNRHSATLLADGKVLIVGGDDNGFYWTSAELYDPTTGQFTPTGSMSVPRVYHSATLLPDGRVLIAGGFGRVGYLDSAEIYDPKTGSFSFAGSLKNKRCNHTETLLPSGKVLITGGVDGLWSNLNSAELYDPGLNSFLPLGQMKDYRFTHTATLLPSGQVLLSGGLDVKGFTFFSLATQELFDPATSTFRFTNSLAQPRHEHTATLLGSGRVLLAGGSQGETRGLASTEFVP